MNWLIIWKNHRFEHKIALTIFIEFSSKNIFFQRNFQIQNTNSPWHDVFSSQIQFWYKQNRSASIPPWTASCGPAASATSPPASACAWAASGLMVRTLPSPSTPSSSTSTSVTVMPSRNCAPPSSSRRARNKRDEIISIFVFWTFEHRYIFIV